MDGVRLNQPFGDVVSWDLLPRDVISSLTLMPGSNPLFGLNTLGGASVRTKDGYANPGSNLRLDYGSSGRASAEIESGGHAASGLHWYALANRLEDDGWRADSPTEATQLFGKIGWRRAANDVSLTAAYADTDLTGNGLQEQQFLARDYASVYTKPDNTKNRSALINVSVLHEIDEHRSFSGNAYWRDLTTRTLNGDINEDSLGENVYQPNATEQAALLAAGYTGFPTSGENEANTPFPSWRCIANILLDTEPNEKCNGLDNRTRTQQSEAGVSGQFTWAAELGDRNNQLTVGAAYQRSRAHFVQSSQFGFLTRDRAVGTAEGPGAFADGSQDSENAFDARVDLTGRTATSSVFAADTLDLATSVALTVSGRYDRTSIANRDALTPAGGEGSLDGDHRYHRFNPAIGLTFAPSPRFGAYVGYDEGSRAPSAIELGCADPDNPCRLPNAMAGDPPLAQVLTKTLEGGVRGAVRSRWSWNLGLFRAENHDDILFVADEQDGFGYFKNFGKTRRQGVELGFGGRVGDVGLGANYTYLDATYRSDDVVNGEANSSADAAAAGFEGNIEIHPGDRIPLTPRHLLKAYVQWDASAKLALDFDARYIGGSFARGNENNEHEPDGLYYLGPGRTGGYAVLGFGADFKVSHRVSLFAQIENLLDRKYFSASQLAATGFTAAGTFSARPFAAPVIDGERPLRNATFFAPGAPRTF
jgi:outer membrane receptor protein involved in Fe transport